jgi:hypothetical protein
MTSETDNQQNFYVEKKRKFEIIWFLSGKKVTNFLHLKMQKDSCFDCHFFKN